MVKSAQIHVWLARKNLVVVWFLSHQRVGSNLPLRWLQALQISWLIVKETVTGTAVEMGFLKVTGLMDPL